MELKQGYKQTELGVIPEAWAVCQLKDLADIHRGASPRPIDAAIWYDAASQVGWVRISDVTAAGGKYLRETKDYLSQQGIDNSRFLPSGSLIMSICATVGMPVITQMDSCIHDGFVGLTRLHGVNKEFLYYKLRELEPTFKSMGQTGSQANLNSDLVRDCVVGLPTIPEQRAIAAALSDIDALITALDRFIAKKRDLKQAAMQQLLTGQLRLPGFHGEWEVKRLGDMADVDSDNLGSDAPAQYRFNYISLEDVNVGTLHSSSEQVFSSAPSRARRRLRAGDILVSTVRPNLQSHLLFTSTQANWVCSTGFAVVRCKRQRADSGYVFFHLFGRRVMEQIEALLTGSNYPAINGGDVERLEIPMPPLPEQAAIALVLSDMEAEIASLEQRRDKTAALKQGMMQELLTGRTRLV